MPESHFYVHIVESPAPRDLFDGRTEGNVLCQALRLAEIKAWYRLASTRELFVDALTSQLLPAYQQLRAAPLIHISAHGNDQGIGLTDGDFIAWSDLSELVAPLNAALNGNLVICMSACQGAAAVRMAMSKDNEPPPFQWLVGNFGSPTWSDSAVAFVTLYHLLFKQVGIEEATAAMRQASGDLGFHYATGAHVQQTFVANYTRFLAESLANYYKPPDQAGGELSAVDS